MKTSLLLLAAVTAVLSCGAKTSRETVYETPEKMGGVYYAYPVTEAISTPAPKGYEPFYISHYGRHGSRYLISDNDYKSMVDKFAKAKDAGALSPLGEKTYQDLLGVWEEAEGRGGELSPLGNRQHAGIAKRMYGNYPQVFSKDADITATSTQVMRCAHSMFAFIEALKEMDPTLYILRESGQREMKYLCYWTQESSDINRQNGRWKPDYVRMERKLVRPDSLLDRLFSDKQYVSEWILGDEFMWNLYWIAVGQQNIENKADFMSLFSKDELYDLWRTNNFTFYAHNASYPRAKGLHVDNAKNLLRHITENADRYISSGRHGATLRFGHDGNITPLLALMKVEGCYGLEEDPMKVSEVWQNFYVSPMASNVQLVFFRNKKDASKPVLVKILHNEKEVHIPVRTDNFPYYDWNDVRAFFETMIKTPFAETFGAN